MPIGVVVLPWARNFSHIAPVHSIAKSNCTRVSQHKGNILNMLAVYQKYFILQLIHATWILSQFFTPLFYSPKVSCAKCSVYYPYLHVGVRNSISTQLQLEVVDGYMKLCRYREEESQLVLEMMAYLTYFKDVVLTGLNISLTGAMSVYIYLICYVLFYPFYRN